MFYVDENTPFYTKQPTAEIKQVFETESKRVLERISDVVASGPVHMGSSSITGMPGSAVVDIAFHTKEFPPSPLTIESLQRIGYKHSGPAPHDPDDVWFMGGDAPVGHLGRVVLHLAGSAAFCERARGFVDYVNSHPEAFQAYADVKLEGAKLGVAKNQNRKEKGEEEDGISPQSIYTMHKAKVVSEILKKSEEWRATAAQEE